jgi:hypothetical protein
MQGWMNAWDDVWFHVQDFINSFPEIGMLHSHTPVSSPWDSTRITYSGLISNLESSTCILHFLQIFNLYSQFLTSSLSVFHIFKSFMGILVNKPGASDGSGNQWIAGANTCYLLQIRVPRLELGTWRNSACAAFRTYQSMNSSIS